MAQAILLAVASALGLQWCQPRICWRGPVRTLGAPSLPCLRLLLFRVHSGEGIILANLGCLSNLQVCSECGEDQAASAFHRSKSYNDGLYGKCKRCCAAALQRRRATTEGGEGGGAAGAGAGPGNRYGRRGQPYSRQPLHAPLGSADIGSMLSDATLYGDPITKVSCNVQ